MLNCNYIFQYCFNLFDNKRYRKKSIRALCDPIVESPLEILLIPNAFHQDLATLHRPYLRKLKTKASEEFVVYFCKK